MILLTVEVSPVREPLSVRLICLFDPFIEIRDACRCWPNGERLVHRHCVIRPTRLLLLTSQCEKFTGVD